LGNIVGAQRVPRTYSRRQLLAKAATADRCRLIPSVTKIRQLLSTGSTRRVFGQMAGCD